jgi:hypothetical protein
VAHTLNWFSELARREGDIPRARELVREAMAVAATMRYRDPYHAWVHHALFGDLALAEGKHEEAAASYQAALALALAHAHRPTIVHLVTILGVLAVRLGTPARGVRWLAAVIHDNRSAVKAPGSVRAELPAEREAALASARTVLGEAAFAAAWAAGQALSLETAAAEALTDESAPPSATSG